MEEFFKQIGTYISEYGFKLLLVLCILIVGGCLAWLIGWLIKKIFMKTRFDGAMLTFIVSLIRIGIVVVAILISSSVLELSTSGLVVSLGTFALAIGLALKDSFANLANGILIIINKPFRRGDYVSINGIEGKVHNIKLLTVELITYDNLKIVLPNNTVLNGNVINYSALALRRVDMTFSVAYGSDMDKVERVLTDIARNHPKILKSMETLVYMKSHDSSAIVYGVRVWGNNGDYYDIVQSFPRLVYDAFEKEGIAIPFNQLDVHINPAAMDEEDEKKHRKES
ncbi:MAG: mechanosensitive ion channel family protein [Bacilli bacterium]|nr:mechanosensitive ion channel family protein [Bacilli bacterium]